MFLLFSKLFEILPKAVRTRTYKGSLIGQLNIFIELSFFYDATTLFNTDEMEQCFIEKGGSNFFPSNCNFSVNIEPIIVCFSSMPQSVLPPGRFLTKEIQFLYRYVSQYFVLLLLPCLQSISSRHWPFIFAACFQIYGV